MACSKQEAEPHSTLLMCTIQIHFMIWTNTFCNLKKYNLQFEQIYQRGRATLNSATGQEVHNANTFCDLANTFSILWFKQIHFTILTNIISNFKKYTREPCGVLQTRARSSLNSAVGQDFQYLFGTIQIHFVILANSFSKLNKYNIQFEQIYVRTAWRAPKKRPSHTADEQEIQYFWKENCKKRCTGQGKVRFHYPAMYFLACAEKSIF